MEEHFAMGALAAMRTPWHGTVPLDPDGSDPYWHDKQVLMQLFVRAAAEEREACAQVADTAYTSSRGGVDTGEIWRRTAATAIAAAIRARGAAPR